MTLSVSVSDSPNAFRFERTNRLRGMLILGIFIFHFCAFFPTEVLPDVGHLIVGAFFMLSGFGLMESYKNKEGYLNNFIGNKTARLLVPVWIAGIIVLMVHWFIWNNHSIMTNHDYLFDLISGGPGTTGTWFVIELIFFYIFFYISFKYLKKNYAIVAVTVATTILMILLSSQQGMWCSSGIMFPLGLILSYYKEKIMSLRFGTVFIFAMINSLIFAYFMKIPRISPMTALFYGNLQCLLIAFFLILSLLAMNISTKKWLIMILFCNIIYLSFQKSLMLGPNIIAVLPFISIITIVAGLNFLSPVTSIVGNFSYEFYIIHAIMVFISKIWFTDMLICFISSLVLSVVMAIFIKKASSIFFNDEKQTSIPTEQS